MKIYAAILTPEDRGVLEKTLPEEYKNIPCEPMFQAKFVIIIAALGLVLAGAALLHGAPLFPHSKAVLLVACAGIVAVALAILRQQNLARQACIAWVGENRIPLLNSCYLFASEQAAVQQTSSLLYQQIRKANERLGIFLDAYRPDLN